MNKKHTYKGFTLIEIGVASFIIAMLGLGVIGIQYIFSRSQVSVWRNYLDIDQANSNVTRLIREIRGARTAEDGSYLLDTVADNEIAFYADIDFDDQAEKVRYYLSGSQLYKGIVEPTDFPTPTYLPENEQITLLTENVRNNEEPVFYYFNADWPNDTSFNPLVLSRRIAETKLVRVYLRLNTQEDEPELDYVLESYTQIRMLKDNL